MDILSIKMPNQQGQEKLCSELTEDLVDALQVAIAFEEGVRRQKTIGQPSTSTKVKEGKSVFTVSSYCNNKTLEIGAGNFTSFKRLKGT